MANRWLLPTDLWPEVSCGRLAVTVGRISVHAEGPMELLVRILGPVAISGYAVQQLLELLDPLLGRLVQPKQVWYGAIALVLGLLLASLAGVRVLGPAGVTSAAPWLDSLVTGLAISASSEGFNSVNKYLAYLKAKEKREARLP